MYLANSWFGWLPRGRTRRGVNRKAMTAFVFRRMSVKQVPSQTLGFPCLAVFKLHAFNQVKSLLGQGGETDLPDGSQFPDKPGCGNRADSPAMSHPASDGKVRVPRPALDMCFAFCLEGPGSKRPSDDDIAQGGHVASLCIVHGVYHLGCPIRIRANGRETVFNARPIGSNWNAVFHHPTPGDPEVVPLSSSASVMDHVVDVE